MKVLVVYDTVSSMRLTEKVAKAVEAVLKEKGVEVDLFFFKNMDKTIIRNYDCVLVGAPTMAFRASSGIMQFLSSLPSNEFSGKLAAAFDTQMQSRLSGNAIKGIEGKLKVLGFKLVTTPLVTYVEGKASEMQLKEGELEKAKNWAKAIVDTLSKASSLQK